LQKAFFIRQFLKLIKRKSDIGIIMKRMGMLLVVLFVFGVNQSVWAQDQSDSEEESKTDYTEAIQLVEVWMNAMQKFDDIPGISAIALNDQDVIWKGAYGEANPDEGVKMEPNTICSVCSISKLFTSVSIMNLYEEGKLRLDDRLEDVMPGYNLEQQFELSGPITIRNLLTHSSGLPRENAYSHWTDPTLQFPTKEQILASLNEQETLYPSSTYFQYSNLAMTLLGYIVEEVSGQTYEEYVTEHILEPLNLNNTRPDMPEELLGSQLAVGYTVETIDGEQHKLDLFDPNGVTPAAGFSSTVQDLADFAAWQFRLYDAEEEEILLPSTIRNMHNIHWMDSDFGTSWGLGFSVYQGPDGKKWVGHGGYCPGYRSTLMMNPKTKMAYSVMTNSNNPDPGKYARGIHALLSKAGSIEKADEELAVELKEYAGYYEALVARSLRYVGTWGDKLVIMNLPASEPGEFSEYRRVDKDHFVRIRDNGEDGENVYFIRNDDGDVVQMKYFNNYISEKIELD